MSQRPACLPLCAFIYVFPYRLFAVDVLGPCMEQLHSHFTPFLTVQKSFVLLSPPLLCLSLFFFFLCSFISLIHTLGKSHTNSATNTYHPHPRKSTKVMA